MLSWFFFFMFHVYCILRPGSEPLRMWNDNYNVQLHFFLLVFLNTLLPQHFVHLPYAIARKMENLLSKDISVTNYFTLESADIEPTWVLRIQSEHLDCGDCSVATRDCFQLA